MFKRKRIKAILCVLLSVSVVFAPSVNIAAQGLIFDNQGIYEEQLFEGGECELGKFSTTAIFAHIRAYPNSYSDTLFATSVIFRLFKYYLPEFFITPFLQILNFQEPFKVYGQANRNYYKIEYFGKTGYILKSQVELMETQQVDMTKSSMNIYAGQSQKLGMKNGLKPTDYKWTSSNSSIATYDPETQTVKTGSVGTATIIGVNGDKCAYCTINVVSKWITEYDNRKVGEISDATVTANVVTSVGARRSPEEIENFHTTIPKDTEVIVRGNIGKWLFVKFYENNKEKFAYVTADYLDTGTSDNTKGDRMFYATLGWRFPVENNKTYNYISSPYGPRSTSPTNHVGVDIVGKYGGLVDKTNYIYKKEVVAACDGKVKASGHTDDMGNYVSIETNVVDPSTNRNLVIVYMHLIDFSEEYPMPSEQTSITKGTVLGLAGSSGNSKGAHLHFDVNNENRVCSYSKEGYAFKHSINPMYFFPSQEIILKDCTSPNGLFWAGTE